MTSSTTDGSEVTTAVVEMNFDGLVGPTHNFAGLAVGNIASAKSAQQVSNPRAAVLEGLAKMSTLHRLGVPQGVLPPHERPQLAMLRSLGFGGDDASLVAAAAAVAPNVLASVYSAAAMWSANAATVSPSADTRDGKVHFTPANLVSSLHRSIESDTTGRALQRIFDAPCFVHHLALPAALGDEGAANHIRLHEGGAGIEIFVWGRAAGGKHPAVFPARQTLEAGQAVARHHGLDAERTLFVRQNPDAIDAGAFHNDVVSVGHERVLLWHADAFAQSSDVDRMQEKLAALGSDLVSWRVSREELSLSEAVATYLFNSQIVTTPEGWVLIAPTECEQSDAARAVIDRLRTEGLAAAHYLDVRQSMRNGGGPACLRLRVSLMEAEQAQVRSACVFDEALHAKLETWATRRYREQLTPADLADPALIDETRVALDELTQILDLGADFYPFQRP